MWLCNIDNYLIKRQSERHIIIIIITIIIIIIIIITIMIIIIMIIIIIFNIKEHMMHPKGDNIKFTSYIDGNEVVNELFNSLRSRCQIDIETSMRASDFIFDSV